MSAPSDSNNSWFKAANDEPAKLYLTSNSDFSETYSICIVFPLTTLRPTFSHEPVPAKYSAAPLIPSVTKSPPPEIARNH